jgi:hypothetical protein
MLFGVTACVRCVCVTACRLHCTISTKKGIGVRTVMIPMAHCCFSNCSFNKKERLTASEVFTIMRKVFRLYSKQVQYQPTALVRE